MQVMKHKSLPSYHFALQYSLKYMYSIDPIPSPINYTFFRQILIVIYKHRRRDFLIYR